jgi:carbonic anhydrase/acetyltransferase-like protein (isoleucine patch superfamily)
VRVGVLVGLGVAVSVGVLVGLGVFVGTGALVACCTATDSAVLAGVELPQAASSMAISKAITTYWR